MPGWGIEEHALIGDTRTAGLAAHGTIDWLCLPRFDSHPVFASLLGLDSEFRIGVPGTETGRRYLPGTPILETTWETSASTITLTEGMVRNLSGWTAPQALFVRRVEVRGEPVNVEVRFRPRLGLEGEEPQSQRRGDAVVCSWGALAVALLGPPELEWGPGEAGRALVSPGRPLVLSMVMADREPLVFVRPEEAWRRLQTDRRQWERWTAGIAYEGAHRAAVERSLITLRLLTFSPSGAPVAAPTTSLPESLGGVRNWDYRYSWIRDASIGLDAFLSVGKVEEAHAYLHWLLHASRLTRPELRVLYTVFGEHAPPETEWEGVPGFARSTPVRTGNAADEQHQLDVYGWLLSAGFEFDERRPIHGEVWRMLAGTADLLCRRWQDPDAGIWEMRGPPRHFVHSKVMAWTGLERVIRMAERRRVASERLDTWKQSLEELGRSIREEGIDHERDVYVQAFGSSELDASLLLLPTTGFEPPSSPRLLATLGAIRRQLESPDFLLHRYRSGVDGLQGDEGAFLPCSFWLVRALAASGRSAEAAEAFDRLCRLSNDVGLYPEEVDPGTKSFLGNFPLAFTHATHVQAALAVERATTRE